MRVPVIRNNGRIARESGESRAADKSRAGLIITIDSTFIAFKWRRFTEIILFIYYAADQSVSHGFK